MGTVVTEGMKTCYNVCEGYYLKRMAYFVLSFCLLVRRSLLVWSPKWLRCSKRRKRILEPSTRTHP